MTWANPLIFFVNESIGKSTSVIGPGKQKESTQISFTLQDIKFKKKKMTQEDT